jgi:hypothetical protein
MITRVALFISLVALFYNYCKEGNSGNNSRQPNEINMQELPADYNRMHYYDSVNKVSVSSDSILYFISISKPIADNFSTFQPAKPQN